VIFSEENIKHTISQFVEECSRLSPEDIDHANRDLTRLRTDACHIIFELKLESDHRRPIINALVLVYDRLLAHAIQQLSPVKEPDDRYSLEAVRIFESRRRILEQLIIDDPIRLMSLEIKL